MSDVLGLRIGIVIAGRVVEERLVRERRPVTLGQSARCTITVGSASLPKAFTLFEPDGDGWALCSGVEGRVSDGDGGSARIVGRDAGRILLGPRARGKVTLGEVTVLFQRLVVPAAGPRPRLPASVRAPLLARIDRMLAAVLVASLAVHFGCVGYLSTIEVARKTDPSDAPPPTWYPAKLRMPAPPIKAQTVEREAPLAGRATRGSSTVKRATKVAVVETAAELAVRRAKLVEEVRRQGAFVVLTSKGDGKDGSVAADLIKSGYVPGNSDDILAKSGGVDIATTAGPVMVRGGSTPGTLRGPTTLRPLPLLHPMPTGPGPKERPIFRPDDEPIDITPGAPNPRAIVEEIKHRIGGFQACYESGMRHDGSAGGKVQLRFSVSALGKVTEVNAEEDTIRNPEILGCILARARTWRFGATGKEYQFSHPFLLINAGK